MTDKELILAYLYNYGNRIDKQLYNHLNFFIYRNMDIYESFELLTLLIRKAEHEQIFSDVLKLLGKSDLKWNIVKIVYIINQQRKIGDIVHLMVALNIMLQLKSVNALTIKSYAMLTKRKANEDRDLTKR